MGFKLSPEKRLHQVISCGIQVLLVYITSLMTGPVIGRYPDSSMLCYEEMCCLNNTETKEREGDARRLLQQDAKCQHRKWGHGISLENVVISLLMAPETHKDTMNETNAYIICFFLFPRTLWTCLQTKPGSSDSMTMRRSGTWSATRWICELCIIN